MTQQSYWEHRRHEFDGAEHETVEADYFYAVCPACGHVNTLLCAIQGKFHLKAALRCTVCNEPLPCEQEFRRAVADGAPGDAEKVVVKEKAPRRKPPSPDDDVINVLDLKDNVDEGVEGGAQEL